MEYMKKAFKSFAVCIILFTALTFILAAMIQFTPFRESWAFGGLMTVMALSALTAGFFAGSITGKKGLFAGAASACLFLFVILFLTGKLFSGGFDLSDINSFYSIPVAAGALGGIAGANRTHM